jgi:probable HAF family extracellular repeat protein
VGGGTVGSVNYLNVVSDQLDTPTGLYASGSFQRTGGGPSSAVARWNGRFWTDVITGSGAFVSAAAFDDNQPGAPAVYFGGLFNQVNGVNSHNIARVVPCPIDDPPRYNVCRYEVTLIDASSLCPTCPYMYGVDLNDAGTVVGSLSTSSYTSKPFEWNASNGLTPITLPTGANIGGVGSIDNHGDVAVVKSDSGSCGLGRLRINGEWSNMIPSQPQTISWLTGINDAHQVCGYRTFDDNNCGVTIAFRWDNGVYTEIVPDKTYRSGANDISPTGDIVGSYRILPQDERAFMLTAGNQFVDLGLLPNGTRSIANAMNSRGVIVGSANVPSPNNYLGENRAVRWVNGVIENLGLLSGMQHSRAADINDRGEIVGDNTWLTGGTIAFVWQNGVMRDLNALIPHHYNSVFRLEYASAINNSGQILANGYRIWEDGYVIALLTPIERLAGDINGDCQVNIDDLVLVIYEWGDAGSVADVNGDGVVDIDDLVWVITHWD